jgi:hypothetical protein
MHEPQQDRVDTVLRQAFAETARPAPSPHFQAKLRAALVEERRRRRAARARMRIMQLYWAFAGLVSLAILAVLSSSPWPAGAWGPLAVVTIVLTLPAALVRVDLVELILTTGKRLRGPLS